MEQSNKPLTAMSISILSLLIEGPMHPYEMYLTLIERHEDQNVKIKPGTLYHTVDRLADRALIEIAGTDRDGNRPERTTYTITDEGRTHLMADLVSLLGTRVNEYPRFPQAISEAHNLPRAIVLDQLRSRIEQFRELLAEFATARKHVMAKEVSERHWLDVDYLETMYQAEVDWLESLLHRLQAREIDWPETYEEIGSR